MRLGPGRAWKNGGIGNNYEGNTKGILHALFWTAVFKTINIFCLGSNMTISNNECTMDIMPGCTQAAQVSHMYKPPLLLKCVRVGKGEDHPIGTLEREGGLLGIALLDQVLHQIPVFHHWQQRRASVHDAVTKKVVLVSTK